MGKGKGSVSDWIYKVRVNQVLFEIAIKIFYWWVHKFCTLPFLYKQIQLWDYRTGSERTYSGL
jgi:hypothetical protein